MLIQISRLNLHPFRFNPAIRPSSFSSSQRDKLTFSDVRCKVRKLNRDDEKMKAAFGNKCMRSTETELHSERNLCSSTIGIGNSNDMGLKKEDVLFNFKSFNFANGILYELASIGFYCQSFC